MIIKVQRVQSRPAGQKGRKTRREVLASCDQCGSEFTRSYRKSFVESDAHYCSVNCQNQSQRKGGNLDKKKKQTFLENFGTDHPLKSEKVKENMKTRSLEKRGVSHHWKDPDIFSKRINTWHSNLGVDNPSKSKSVQSQIRQTMLDRYGFEHAWQVPEFREKALQTLRDRHGVDNPCELRDNVDWHSAWQKGHETKKANGSYATSKFEQEVFEFCLSHSWEIERQKVVETWAIDFYFPVRDLYLQADGAYWHAKGENVSLLAQSNSPRDRARFWSLCRDQEQDKWFSDNGLTLIRIFDDEDWKKCLLEYMG